MSIGIVLAIVGGVVVVLAIGIALMFWTKRRSAAEAPAAPAPVELKPIVPKAMRPRTPPKTGADPSDENLLQFGAVGKMNVPSRRPVPQTPSTTPTPPIEPAAEAPRPATSEPPKFESQKAGPPRLPSSSAPPPGGMPSVPSGLTSAAAKPLALVPEIVETAKVSPAKETPSKAAAAAPAAVGLAQAGASSMADFLNEPPKAGNPVAKPVASLAIDLGSFSPPRATPPPSGVAAAQPPADVASLKIDLNAMAPTPAKPAIAHGRAGHPDVPALKLDEHFKLEPVAQVIHDQDTKPDAAPHPPALDLGPSITLSEDFSLPAAETSGLDGGPPNAFEGVPVLSLDLPELAGGLDPSTNR